MTPGSDILRRSRRAAGGARLLRLGRGAALAADGVASPWSMLGLAAFALVRLARETSYDAVVEALLAHRRAGGSPRRWC